MRTLLGGGDDRSGAQSVHQEPEEPRLDGYRNEERGRGEGERHHRHDRFPRFHIEPPGAGRALQRPVDQTERVLPEQHQSEQIQSTKEPREARSTGEQDHVDHDTAHGERVLQAYEESNGLSSWYPAESFLRHGEPEELEFRRHRCGDGS